MIDHGNVGARICVIGRTTFDTGIGAFSHAACELFSRHLPTCIIPTDRGPGDDRPVELPSGRSIPVCTDPGSQDLFFYADVLVNNARDVNLSRMPMTGFHVAHFCFDSDELPTEWVYALNQRFDIAYVPTLSQQRLAIDSGVRIPVGVLPIALPLEQFLARTPRVPGPTIRFGTVTAFHERKELELLVQAFIREFAGRHDVELVLHSNLAFGEVYDRITEAVDGLELPKVVVSNANLSARERDILLETFDVFVNCSRGEGYSIGAREALALGKALVLSDIGVHRDLTGLPGVQLVPADAWTPARYPEIDNRVIGRQQRVTVDALRDGLRDAARFVASDEYDITVPVRRRRAADFSFTHLSIEYAAIVDPDAELTRLGSRAVRSDATYHPAEMAPSFRKRRATDHHPQWRNKLVVPAHDGGFFSVFNVYMSHLVWSLQDDRCHMVLPDWDQSRLVDRPGSVERTSFCYGKFSDGNIWTHLFEPPFGCTSEQLDDIDFLYTASTTPEAHFNERREPMLTYYHAYDLYRGPSFARFRRQYHTAYSRHVRLLPDLQSEIDSFVDQHVGSRHLLAAHVKHPSHVIEQPDELMAAQHSYFDFIEAYLDEHSFDVAGDDWRLFLGTDQEAVVTAFTDEYGEHVVSFPEIRRTTTVEDARYAEAAGENRGAIGFQVQHLVAASPDNWSTDMAREVLRDSHLMARADVLFHVVSNVATAAAYMNPDMEMRFVTHEVGTRQRRGARRVA